MEQMEQNQEAGQSNNVKVMHLRVVQSQYSSVYTEGQMFRLKNFNYILTLHPSTTEVLRPQWFSVKHQ